MRCILQVVEVCDANDVDENCDGVADGADAVGATDWYFDGDADGYGDPNVTRRHSAINRMDTLPSVGIVRTR